MRFLSLLFFSFRKFPAELRFFGYGHIDHGPAVRQRLNGHINPFVWRPVALVRQWFGRRRLLVENARRRFLKTKEWQFVNIVCASRPGVLFGWGSRALTPHLQHLGVSPVSTIVSFISSMKYFMNLFRCFIMSMSLPCRDFALDIHLSQMARSVGRKHPTTLNTSGKSRNDRKLCSHHTVTEL